MKLGEKCSVVDRTEPDLPDLPNRFEIWFGIFLKYQTAPFLIKLEPTFYLKTYLEAFSTWAIFGQISEIFFKKIT